MNKKKDMDISKKNEQNDSCSKKNFKIRLIKSKYFHNDLLHKRVNSPLSREYESLKSYLPNSQRYLKYLTNSDFDTIFKCYNISTQKPFYHEKIIINPKNILSHKNKRKYRSKSQIEDIDFRDVPKRIHFRLSAFPYTKNKNNLILTQKNTNNKKHCLKGNILYDLNSVNKNLIKLVDKSKRYLKFTSRLKKQTNKNFKLLLDIKKEETIYRKSLLPSLAKYNINRDRIKSKSHRYIKTNNKK